jgi:hypothetical protein
MRPHPFGSPFDSLMVPSRVEALTGPSPAEGRSFGSGSSVELLEKGIDARMDRAYSAA